MTDHKICDACECVAHCSKQGCIPLTEPVIRRAEGGAAERDPLREAAIIAIGALERIHHATESERTAAADALRDALAFTAPAKPKTRAALQGGDAASEAVPKGWQLVPREPTAKMMGAAWDHTPLDMDDMTDGSFGQAYKDMLAAAPDNPLETAGMLGNVADRLASREQAVDWGDPKTVGMFVRQLQTIAPETPIHAAVHTEIDGKRVALTKPVIISHERVAGRRIRQGDESVPYSIVVWAQQDQASPAATPTAPKAHGGRNGE